MLTAAAKPPVFGSCACFSISSTARAASSPMRLESCSNTAPCTWSAPKNRPATVMMITSSGASEKTE